MKKIKFIWHHFWFKYNHALKNSCNDELLRQKYLAKVKYHESNAIRIISNL